MTKVDTAYLQEEIRKYKKQILKDIAEDCLNIFKDSIREAVYDYYTPTWYDRTYQLIESATYKIENDILYLFINTDEMTYHSWINFKDTGKEVTSIVPYLVEVGHMGRHTEESENQYNNYEPRFYLERAKMKIDSKYGIDVEIINDKPNRI